MKGLSFNVIVFATIALVSVVILIIILNSIVPNFMGRGLCKVYQIFLSLPLPEQLKPPIPGCSFFPSMERVKLIDDRSNVQTLTDYLESCWKKSDEGRSGLTFICYELFMEDVPEPFDYNDIQSPLRDQDKIEWGTNPPTGEISGGDVTIIIKYNAESGRIEVI